ncbi:MAG: hypothetical protein GC181_05090 [Bacteroidetes bacterium]|nr:hypothetical protein [Bacteroidota bacterium]
MKTIPQRVYINPAMNSDAKTFIALPGVSSQFVDFRNSAFSLNKIASTIDKAGPDSSVININKAAGLFNKENFISISNSFDIFSIGMRVRPKTYLYLTSSFNSEFRFTYPGDLFKLVAQGNAGDNIDKTFDLGFGIDLLQYIDAGIGLNHTFLGDRLTIGARYRFIKGINVVHTEKNDLKFSTDPNTFDLTVASNIKINFASSLANADSIGGILDSLDNGVSTIASGNTGQAIDIGVSLKLTEKITLSACVNNLGFIKWTNTSFTLASENPGASYTYKGVKINDVFKSDGTALGNTNNVIDTLKERFRLEEHKETFKTNLFAQFYFGGQYNFAKHHNAGILFTGNYYQKKLYPSFTLSWNSRITRILGVSASYSAINTSPVNLGLGVSVNVGPLQVYMVSDNIGGVFAPADVQNVNMRAGFNLTINRKDPNAKEDRKERKAEKKAKKEKKEAEKKASSNS